MDEPTAALDARAEVEVFDRIRALADSGQTVVLITHRLASVRHADLVHVLDQGKLVESGAPDELLAAGGLYAELYALQADQFSAPLAPPAGRCRPRGRADPRGRSRGDVTLAAVRADDHQEHVGREVHDNFGGQALLAACVGELLRRP
ncbi:hypothetical protein SHKM778_69880 [Streptomyces sp. KM77-8]|uniref:ABC transporter ATP-binding protein n=1 Tax=Streptomyces haneummycinicus TaxID=3074435 RepID=A0AAT9HSV7_9ACTN